VTEQEPSVPTDPPPIKVAILGASGYTAAELIRLLLRHPNAEIVALTTHQDVDRELAEVHPALTGRLRLRLERLTADELVGRGVQCAFACLPHGKSMGALPHLLDRGLRAIDLSADYRLADPNLYAHWYGESHSDLAHLAQAVYGLPELYGEELRTSPLVANPGCYPQGAILGLAPLVAGSLIDLSSIIIDSKSGVTGAGRTPTSATHFPECNESIGAYNVGRHRHTPEIEQALTDIAGITVEVLFTPHLVPMDRGILSTIYVNPSRKLAQDKLLELYRDFYHDAPFIRIVDHLPATKHTLHSNFLDITLRIVRNRIIVFTALDNLVRGASGAAIQNFNRMYGFEETRSLM
jgi:N-acetyl-gamma-glutamyl-phosphate reductase